MSFASTRRHEEGALGSSIPLAAIFCAAVAGCATHVYHEEAFRADTPYSKRIAGERVCDSVKRALLNQGYALEPRDDAETLTATKAFQRDDLMVTLRMRTSCMDNADGTHTVFASALEEVNELQTIKQPAGVTVAGFGFTIPSGSARLPTTIKRETVQDADFYARFFKLVDELAGLGNRR